MMFHTLAARIAPAGVSRIARFNRKLAPICVHARHSRAGLRKIE